MPPYTPISRAIPASGKRPKTGGRKKGTPNRTTVLIREATLQVFADLQAEAGGNNDHYLRWARNNPKHFYLMLMRLLPRRVSAPEAYEPPVAPEGEASIPSNGGAGEISR